MANVYHQILGAKSHAQGQRFEAELNRAFEYYRVRGMAAIEKTPEPMRPIKNLGYGRFVAVFEQKAQADYSGVLRGGQAVVMEAKFTSTGRIEQSRVTSTQAEHLRLRQTLGAKCFVLAGFSSGGVYRVPWTVWQDMKAIFGRKYVTENDLTKYRVPRKTTYPLVLDGLV